MSDLKIYTKVGCPYCVAAKEYYDQRKIKYTEIDVHETPGAADEAMKLANGARRVPVIVEGRKVTVGFRGGS